jgi:hypothetical protein
MFPDFRRIDDQNIYKNTINNFFIFFLVVVDLLTLIYNTVWVLDIITGGGSSRNK